MEHGVLTHGGLYCHVEGISQKDQTKRELLRNPLSKEVPTWIFMM